ncbi:hypothetical protein ABB02_01270 [Clostridiaceae bacterium JG1575]|nr:hypothetical protein ABB02_01270 [Clostridiaceae bacterium JG1575]
MRKKPSMYSEHYLKGRRRRRRGQALLILGGFLLLFFLFFIPYYMDKVATYKAQGGRFEEKPPSLLTQAGANTTVPKQTTPKSVPQTKIDPTQQAKYKLQSGEEVTILFQKGEGGLRFRDVQGPKSFQYDISPEGKGLLINETRPQTLVLIGEDLLAKDVTMASFEFTEGEPTLQKDAIQKEGFIWMKEARFLSEDVIVFPSQLTRLEGMSFLWAYDRPSGKYQQIPGTKAQRIHLLERTTEGIRFSMDDEVKTLKETLEVAP